jgi:copper resistance protein D
MAWEIHQILKGLHIFLAIVWVGGILFVGWGVYPAIKSLQFADQRKFLTSLMNHTHWLFTLVGAGVITTGVLLGTVLGPIKNWNHLWHTTYGNIWLSALLISIFTLLWGIFVGYTQTMKMLSNDELWQRAETGDPAPLIKTMKATALLESVEIVGFIILLILMMLLR